MKKIILLFTLMSIVACKKKEVNQETTTKKESAEVVQEKPATPDYASFGMESENAPKGLQKGTMVPNVDFTIEGKQVALSDLYKDEKVALIFYRGFWCPFCNKQLSEFATKAKDLEAKGIKLIAITPEGDEGIAKTKEKTGANFTIVSDKDGSIMEAFDVDYNVTEGYISKVNEMLKVNIMENNANGKAELPVPATFVIDTDGIILFSHFDPNYKNRASIDDILSAI
jgi:peroxiredoxin